MCLGTIGFGLLKIPVPYIWHPSPSRELVEPLLLALKAFLIHPNPFKKWYAMLILGGLQNLSRKTKCLMPSLVVVTLWLGETELLQY